jgi:hypothetical protein
MQLARGRAAKIAAAPEVLPLDGGTLYRSRDAALRQDAALRAGRLAQHVPSRRSFPRGETLAPRGLLGFNLKNIR